MPHEKWFVDGDIFKRLDALAFVYFKHSINQQNRIAVRQLLENLVNVHHDFFFIYFWALSIFQPVLAGREVCAVA